MRLSLIAVVAFATAARAACSTADGAYEPISSIKGPNVCYPTNFFQAQDVGQTTQSSLMATCRAKCSSNTLPQKCVAYVGVLNKAGDSNLYTGQCYYYATAALSPRQCADYPTIIFAEHVDNSLSCLQSGGSQATAYCSSYISVGTKTVYTKTVTPTASTTVTVSTSTTTYTTTSVTATTLSTTTITSAAATSYPFTSTATATTTVYSILYQGTFQKVKRAAAANPPPCLTTTSVAASRISSACSCLSIASSTVNAVSTASTTTITSTVTGTTVTKPGTRTTTASTQTNLASATTSITSLATTTSTTTVTMTATCTQPTGNLLANGGFETGIPPWTMGLNHGSNSVSVQGPGSNSPNAFYITLTKGSNSLYAQTFYYQQITATVCPGAKFTVSFDYQYPGDGRLDISLSDDMNDDTYPDYGSKTYIAQNNQGTSGFQSGSFVATIPQTKPGPNTYLTFVAEQFQSSNNPSALVVYDNFVVQAIVPT